jgi:DNA adenine methylase
MKPAFPYYGAKARLAPWIVSLMPRHPDDHRDLAEVLHRAAAAVLLSGYPSPLYDELYADWWRVEQRVQRPTSNQRGRTGAAGVEVVWSNRPLPVQEDLLSEVLA